MAEVKVGDRVAIVKPGNNYPDATHIASVLGMKNFSGQPIMGVVEPGELKGVVIGLTTDGFGNVVAGVDTDRGGYVLNVEGLEVLTPREYVEFQQVYKAHGKGHRPVGMICLVHDDQGRTHLGTSWCNWEAGDTYIKKKAKRIARERAEIARNYELTAYFKDSGGPMMMFDIENNQDYKKEVAA